MNKIFVAIICFFLLFTACETDFDVNADWEEITVVYGLLNAGDSLQQVKISKAFLGEMDALQMAQYADSSNYSVDELDVVVYKLDFNEIEDSIVLVPNVIVRDGSVFNDSVVSYEFSSNELLLETSYTYDLVIKNKRTGNIVTGSTNIIDDFKFDIPPSYQFGFVQPFAGDIPPDTIDYAPSSVEWLSAENGKIYQLDLIFNYTENDVVKSLVFSQGIVDDTEDRLTIEGEDFFNFLAAELIQDSTKVRFFNYVDILMTVGTQDLETYINVNKPISGIVQERPYFSNINNGIGLFSSKLTVIKSNIPLTPSTLKYLRSDYGLDRNFQ